MKVVKTIEEMRRLRQQTRGTVGFVPTMGYLHEGHLSLVRRAKENDTVVVSIYVNPTQFGPKEDFKSYPRDIPRDLAMLESLTDIVFMPEDAEMYPAGYDTWVEVKGITEGLEGATRPGHFRGVATVVTKLLNIVGPTRAYFGQKDAQQVAVIKKMAVELDMDLELIACPTVREPDGLAMSSRNVYLDPEERRGAAVLFKALTLAQELWKNGEKDADTVLHRMMALIKQEPLANIVYISIADGKTLKDVEEIKPPALVSLAVRFGKTRLIDNVVIG
ncbi:MAG: pantoate--beta-alanine ligase [Chloroflexi bacterium RBG_16_56_11]|nr:MAG: pantoate--beta-alanine ligase [Chloroflexi bacterium RBG_16_56_11]